MLESERKMVTDLNDLACRGELIGVFSDIPIEVYHACAGISSSQLKPIIARLRGFEYETPEDSDALRFGNAFHTYLLEPEAFDSRYVVGLAARATGKILVTPSEMDLIRSMAASFRLNEDAMDLFADSQKELSFFFVDQKTGILQKCRTDIFQNRAGEVRPSDIKTCQSAKPVEFGRASRKLLYRVSAAYYLKVIGESMDRYLREFHLIACSKRNSNQVVPYLVDADSIAKGAEEVRAALDVLAAIKERGEAVVWKELESGIKEINI